MRKKLHGSAILWAVCSLLVVMVIITGIFSLNKIYVRKEIQSIEKKQAQYYARSGISITARLIEDGDESVSPDINNVIKVEYDWCDVKIEQSTDFTAYIHSSSTVGNTVEEMRGLMIKSGEKWELKGYVTY